MHRIWDQRGVALADTDLTAETRTSLTLWLKMPARTLLFVFMVKLLDGELSGFRSLDVGNSVPSACDRCSYMFRANCLTGW